MLLPRNAGASLDHKSMSSFSPSTRTIFVFDAVSRAATCSGDSIGLIGQARPASSAPQSAICVESECGARIAIASSGSDTKPVGRDLPPAGYWHDELPICQDLISFGRTHLLANSEQPVDPALVAAARLNQG